MTVRHPEKVNKKSNPIPKKPNWIRVKAPTSSLFEKTKKIVKKNHLITVCEAVSYTHLTLPTKA